MSDQTITSVSHADAFKIAMAQYLGKRDIQSLATTCPSLSRDMEHAKTHVDTFDRRECMECGRQFLDKRHLIRKCLCDNAGHYDQPEAHRPSCCDLVFVCRQCDAGGDVKSHCDARLGITADCHLHTAYVTSEECPVCYRHSGLRYEGFDKKLPTCRQGLHGDLVSPCEAPRPYDPYRMSNYAGTQCDMCGDAFRCQEVCYSVQCDSKCEKTSVLCGIFVCEPCRYKHDQDVKSDEYLQDIADTMPALPKCECGKAACSRTHSTDIEIDWCGYCDDWYDCNACTYVYTELCTRCSLALDNEARVKGEQPTPTCYLEQLVACGAPTRVIRLMEEADE